jgi:acylphosphatase
LKATVYIRVCGVVQGVGFRYFTKRQAKLLEIHGHVRNLFDGDVEIEAEGERRVLEEFIRILKVGPPAAQVTDVQVQWTEAKGLYPDFQIKF